MTIETGSRRHPSPHPYEGTPLMDQEIGSEQGEALGVPEAEHIAKATIGSWVVLDLFGRQRAAGYLTTVKLGAAEFLRLQIPASNGQQARTIDFNPSAIYSTEYVNEETARLCAAHDRPPEPVSVWSARAMVRDSGSQLALESRDDDDPEDPF
jgi:hypothetical protein